jgi:hypothetical protein
MIDLHGSMPPCLFSKLVENGRKRLISKQAPNHGVGLSTQLHTVHWRELLDREFCKNALEFTMYLSDCVLGKNFSRWCLAKLCNWLSSTAELTIASSTVVEDNAKSNHELHHLMEPPVDGWRVDCPMGNKCAAV